jgi:hypothetical protein
MATPDLTHLGDAFGSRHKRFFNQVRNRPGHFVAVTTHAPGIDTNPSIRWKQTTTVITGPVVSP